MALNPRTWYPIAAVLSVVNLAAVAFAVFPASPWHATLHAGLALAFGVWAQRLRGRRQASLPAGEADREADALQDEVEDLRGELGELQERLDFTERLLRQERELLRRPAPPPGE